jgi:hypothetical protein
MLNNTTTGKCLTMAGGVSTDNKVPALQFDCDSDIAAGPSGSSCSSGGRPRGVGQGALPT